MTTTKYAGDAFKFECPHCAQSLEATMELVGESLDCPTCGKGFKVPTPKSARIAKPNTPVKQQDAHAVTSHRGAMPGEIMTNVKQGAIIGGWACFGLGIICMFLSLFTFFLYVPFFLVAFILSIVAMSQRRVAQGIILLIATLIIPTIFGVILTASRAAKFADDFTKSSAKSKVDVVTTANGTTHEEKNSVKGVGTQKESLLDKLDQKNGFQDFKLGSPLSQFSGLKPATMLFKTEGDEKNFTVENFNPKLGNFEISNMLLTFEMGLLKEIRIYASGKQNMSGLKETLIQGYGQPESGSWMGNSFVWTGKKVVLRLSDSITDDSATATFESKEVEARIKTETNRKAKEGAADASKEL